MNGFTRIGLGIMLGLGLLAIIVAATFTGGEEEKMVAKEDTATAAMVPPIDAAKPINMATATFALG